MFRLLGMILGLKRRDLKIIKVVSLGFFYALLLLSSSFVGSLTFLKWPIMIIFAATIALYMMEKSKKQEATDNFEDDNLFFRHGKKISSVILPIKCTQSLTNDENDSLVSEMINTINTAMKDEIDGRIVNGTHLSEVLTVKDKRKATDVRNFLRFSYLGSRGGELANFVNFQYIGKYIVINFDTYMKGIPHWYDKLDFLFTSPVRIWFWVFPWIRQNFSILSAISPYLDNSFEEYDIYDYLQASQYAILDSVKEFLQEKNLLSEEVKGMIFNQLVFNNNYGNQVNVGGANNLVGNIAQTAARGVR